MVQWHQAQLILTVS